MEEQAKRILDKEIEYFFTKLDIKNAYLHVPINIRNHHQSLSSLEPQIIVRQENH